MVDAGRDRSRTELTGNTVGRSRSLQRCCLPRAVVRPPIEGDVTARWRVRSRRSPRPSRARTPHGDRTAGITRPYGNTSGGEKADLVEVTSVGMDQLEKEKLIRGESRVEIARALIGIAVREGAAAPDISRPRPRSARCSTRDRSYVNPRLPASRTNMSTSSAASALPMRWRRKRPCLHRRGSHPEGGERGSRYCGRVRKRDSRSSRREVARSAARFAAGADELFGGDRREQRQSGCRTRSAE